MGAHGSNLDEILAEDMHHWYNKFMRESPSGLITLFELKTMLQMQGMTEEASSYVDQVFFTFDMDGVRATNLIKIYIKIYLNFNLASFMFSHTLILYKYCKKNHFLFCFI